MEELFYIIQKGNLSHEERKFLERIYEEIYLFKNKAQAELACNSYLDYIHEFRSYNSVLGGIKIVNTFLYDLVKNVIYPSINILLDNKNQKE